MGVAASRSRKKEIRGWQRFEDAKDTMVANSILAFWVNFGILEGFFAKLER